MGRNRNKGHQPVTPPNTDDQDYLKLCQENEQEAIDQFDKHIIALVSGAFAISFVFLKDVVKPADVVYIGVLIMAWVCWSAAMLCTLLSFLASHEGARQAQRAFRRGLRGEGLLKACWCDPWTRRLNPIAGVFFMAGLISMTVFVTTNLSNKHEATSTGSAQTNAAQTNASGSSTATNTTATRPTTAATSTGSHSQPSAFTGQGPTNSPSTGKEVK